MDASQDTEDAVPLLDSSGPSSRSFPRYLPASRSRMAWIKQTKPLRPPSNLVGNAERPPNLTYVYYLSAFVSLGALLFGYDQGIMGQIVADERWRDLMKPANPCTIFPLSLGARPHFFSSYSADHDTGVTGTVISLYDVGCAFGAMSIGYLADVFGRERTLSLATIVFICGALIQAASFSVVEIVSFIMR
jgi:hypothetical protein